MLLQLIELQFQTMTYRISHVVRAGEGSDLIGLLMALTGVFICFRVLSYFFVS